MENDFGKLPVPPTSELLGYLAPGATILGIMYAVEASVEATGSYGTPIHSAARMLGWDSMPPGWVSQAFLVSVVTLLCYTVGHFLDSLAKLLIDRTLIFKGYGYPYQYLLALPNLEQRAERAVLTRNWRIYWRQNDTSLSGGKLLDAVKSSVGSTPRRSDLSEAFYRGIFFWVNLYLAVRWFSLYSEARSVGDGGRGITWTLASALGIWCVVLIVFKLFCGRQIRSWVRDVHEAIGEGREASLKRTSLVIYRAVSLGLYDVVAAPLGKMLRTRRSLDSAFVRAYKSCYRARFQLRPETAESNNYWFPYAYLLTQSPACTQVLARYHQLYRFSRNMSVALYGGFVYCLLWHYWNIRFGNVAPGAGRGALEWIGAIFFASFVFLLHFYYLYVCYYSKFLFRAFVMLEWPVIAGRRSGGAGATGADPI